MTIWYDMSGLVDWPRPHLGGIERTTAGILDGLAGCGVGVKLVRFTPDTAGFTAVRAGDLPEAVRQMCLRLAGASPPDSVAVGPLASAPADEPAGSPAAARLERQRRRRDAIYGVGPEGEALRAAWREFRVAGKQLAHQLGRRIGLPPPRRGITAIAVPTPPAADPPAPVPTAFPFAAGDVLLSLGGTFATPGHPDAIEAARQQGVRIVRMVYDLVPVSKPQWLAPRAVEVRWLRHVLTRSDLVLTISECTRREVDDYCRESGLDVPRTAVVRLGDVIRDTAHDAGRADLPAALPRFVPQRPFFLCVSSINIRKNHRCLYEAWSVLAAERAAECPDLLCVGTPHAHVADLIHEIRHDPAVNRHLHLLDGIRDAELDWYYRHCVATIYPSKHEGWGLPVAESLGYGKVCLAASAASITEISPDLPEFFAPHDMPRLVALVGRALDVPEWRAAREARIRAEFRPTTWTETAAEILTAVGLVAGHAGRMPGVAA